MLERRGELRIFSGHLITLLLESSYILSEKCKFPAVMSEGLQPLDLPCSHFTSTIY